MNGAQQAPIFFRPEFGSMDNQLILKKIEELVAPVLGNLGYELVERELLMDGGRWVLRLYIDRESGVTIDDCARASHSVDDLIEVEEVIPVAYTLEVSSPGLNRPLRRREDFEKFCGSIVKLKTLHPVNGRSNYKGILVGMDGDDIVMSIDGTEYNVPLGELSRARVEVGEVSSKSKTVN